jgi:hypothetical protein
VLRGPRLIVGQVGDSRAYIFRQGKLIRITKDQSLVQQLIDAKQLTEEEAKNFDRSNIILQALGTAAEVQVDMTSAVLRKGDLLMMCSDGLCGLAEDDEIEEAISGAKEPMEACRVLTDLACENGGHDNITVIVSVFDGEGLSKPREEDVLEYRKFFFNQVTETTVRSTPPTSEDEAGQEGGSDEESAETGDAMVSEAPPPPNRVPLFFAAGIIVIALIAGALALLSGEEDRAAPPASSVSAPATPKVPAAPEPPPVEPAPVDEPLNPEDSASGAGDEMGTDTEDEVPEDESDRARERDSTAAPEAEPEEGGDTDSAAAVDAPALAPLDEAEIMSPPEDERETDETEEPAETATPKRKARRTAKEKEGVETGDGRKRTLESVTFEKKKKKTGPERLDDNPF